MNACLIIGLVLLAVSVGCAICFEVWRHHELQNTMQQLKKKYRL